MDSVRNPIIIDYSTALLGKIEEILYSNGKTQRKIVKYIANKRLPNKGVQSTLKLSEPIKHFSL